jgi:ribosomal protein S27AE
LTPADRRKEIRYVADDPMCCPRCSTGLEYKGTKKFHEGTRWSVFGELGELFENREHFDVYMCPRCGRVELFVDGVGEEFRSR